MSWDVNHFLFYLALVVWCILHSALISNNFVKKAKIASGSYFRYYRLLYNLFSLVTFIPLMIYSWDSKSEVIFSWDGYWFILRIGFLLLVAYLFIAGAKNYDTQQFLGLRQIKSNSNHKTLSKDSKLNINGLQAYIRHPWYTGTILLLWSRNMYSTTIIENIILTSYVIIGTLLEERKLISEFGENYHNYQKQVSMLIPVKWLKSKILTVLFIIALIFNNYTSAAQTDTTKILFIGSSYFNYNDLPTLFKNLADSSDKHVFVDRAIRNGLYLSDHADLSTTENKINEKEWNFVVLQGVGSVTAYPKYYTQHPVYPSLITLRNKIKDNSEKTKMIFCMPWAFEDGMTWLAGWTDTYEDMQIKIYDNTLQYSNEIDFTVAPVGWAWYKVLKEKNYPLHYLHLMDWNHPTPKGSYLMACVIYSTIFQENTTGNAFINQIDLEEANDFQSIASSTVMDSLSLWNITETTSYLNFPDLNKISLSQNYPNPFTNITRINYTVKHNSLIEIFISDLEGKIQRSLITKYIKSGNYSYTLQGENLNNGLYIYGIKANNQVETKLMHRIK